MLFEQNNKVLKKSFAIKRVEMYRLKNKFMHITVNCSKGLHMTEAGGQGVQGYPLLHSGCLASLGCTVNFRLQCEDLVSDKQQKSFGM